MKTFLRAASVLLSFGMAHAAESAFSRRLSPEDFRAAGLGKLTGEEIARLDALVERERAGAVANPASGGSPAAGAAVRAPVPSSAEADRDAKVVIAPGTIIEFSAVESRLTGVFTGWEPRGVFALENGQRWREANGTTYVSPPLSAPKVRIMPGALGTYWMEIEGVRVRVKVVRIDSGR